MCWFAAQYFSYLLIEPFVHDDSAALPAPEEYMYAMERSIDDDFQISREFRGISLGNFSVPHRVDNCPPCDVSELFNQRKMEMQPCH
jgi:hypothetical protein